MLNLQAMRARLMHSSICKVDNSCTRFLMLWSGVIPQKSNTCSQGAAEVQCSLRLAKKGSVCSEQDLIGVSGSVRPASLGTTQMNRYLSVGACVAKMPIYIPPHAYGKASRSFKAGGGAAGNLTVSLRTAPMLQRRFR